MTWGVRDLVAGYGRSRVVEGLTISVEPGSVTALVGGDGSGKSTVARVMAGALEPMGGTVRRPPPERVGYSAADSGVYRDLTVEENLEFAGRAYGVADWRAAARPLLERTGLAGARDRLGGQLSGGMRHKLALAMALLHRPELLVLDEPTTGLDPVSRVELWRLVGNAAAEGAAVLLTTTYLDEAERAARVVVLDGGRQLVAGAPEEVLAALPGAVLEVAERPAGLSSWRRGRRFRVWSPDGRMVPGGREVRPDLEDAVVVAALARSATVERTP